MAPAGAIPCSIREDQRLENWKLRRAFFFRLEQRQRLRDAVPDRAGLAGQSTAGDRDDDVVLARAAHELQRLLDDHLQHGTGEIHLDRPLVHDDAA